MNRENKRKQYEKGYIIRMHAMTLSPVRYAAVPFFRRARVAVTATIARTAFQACMWTRRRVTGLPTAAALWSQSAYGCAKTANGRSFIGAAGAKN